MTPAVNSAINVAGRNAVIIALMVGCAFVACWTPFMVIGIVYNITKYIDFGGVFYNFSMALALTNSCVNPFIYAAKYREFQDGVKRLVSKMKGSKPTQIQVAPVA